MEHPMYSLFRWRRRRRRAWERGHPCPLLVLPLSFLHNEATRPYTLGPALLLLCLLLSHALPCAADGIFIPPVAVERLPDIPRQQAFISYFNGEQELIIQSDFQGEGSDFAWIIPTPAEPVHIEKADPDLFHHLRYAMRPITIYGPTWRLVLGAFLLVWAIFHLAIGPHGRSADAPLRGILFAAGVLFFAALAYAIAGLPLATLRSSPEPIAVEPGVTVLQSATIGNYDIRVLDAKTPAALRQWLTDNAFNTLPPHGDHIVQDYIDQGWTFTAAKLRREAGESPPENHPNESPETHGATETGVSNQIASLSKTPPTARQGVAGRTPEECQHLPPTTRQGVAGRTPEECQHLPPTTREGVAGRTPEGCQHVARGRGASARPLDQRSKRNNPEGVAAPPPRFKALQPPPGVGSLTAASSRGSGEAPQCSRGAQALATCYYPSGVDKTRLTYAHGPLSSLTSNPALLETEAFPHSSVPRTAPEVGDVAPGAKPDSNAMPQQSSVPRTAPGDVLRPHPIALRFPTDTPIYPMRLTQLAGGDLHLDLYLLAEQRAEVPGMQTKFCQQVNPENGLGERQEGPPSKGVPASSRVGDVLPEAIAKTILEDSARSLLRAEDGTGGCSSLTTTHLTATLNNTQLDHDYPIHFRPYAPTQSKVWLPRGFRWTLIERSLLAFTLPLLLGALWRYWLREKAKTRRGLWVFVLAGVALVAAIPYWTYSACLMGVEMLYDYAAEIYAPAIDQRFE